MDLCLYVFIFLRAAIEQVYTDGLVAYSNSMNTLIMSDFIVERK